MISGTRVATEVHVYVIPPQVNAMAAEVELPTKIRFPLKHE